MAKPMIRHIAVCAEDVRGLADFYKATFGMDEVGGVNPGDGKFAVFLSDGYINLAILPARGGKEGINHLGFQVDDIEATGRVAKEGGAQTGIAPRPRDGRYAEFRFHDPVGTPVDLSEAGWATERPPAEAGAARG
ncbi:MAG TPA: VOC family protein [Chloroflexota bacterium]|nr:VOC family protein [Chloroflexota bacterium]